MSARRTDPTTTTTPDEQASADALVARMRAGERRALSQAVSALERLSSDAGALIAAMTPHLGQATVVGITGPPGAGKSTLVAALVRELSRRGRALGIIAVDPSSPLSGGAILGDRLRMTASLEEADVFMRSLSSSGHVGGLSPAAMRVIDALDAAGKEIVLLETVGAGQSEIDVAMVADVRVVVGAPGLGDDVQAIKSGLLEIADILVVNKADREGADRTAAELKAAMSLRVGAAEVPVLLTSAMQGRGIDVLADAIEARAALSDGGTQSGLQRRQRRACLLIARQAAQMVSMAAGDGASPAMAGLAEALLAGRMAPEEAARELLRQLGASRAR